MDDVMKNTYHFLFFKKGKSTTQSGFPYFYQLSFLFQLLSFNLNAPIDCNVFFLLSPITNTISELLILKSFIISFCSSLKNLDIPPSNFPSLTLNHANPFTSKYVFK